MVLLLSRERNLENTTISCLRSIHMPTVTQSLIVITHSLSSLSPFHSLGQPANRSVTHSMTVTLCHSHCHSHSQPATQSLTAARSVTQSLDDFHSLSLSQSLHSLRQIITVTYCYSPNHSLTR